MHLVYGCPDQVRRFIEQGISRCTERGLPDHGIAIGVANEDNIIVGGFYYHDYDPDAGVIEVSMASNDKRWWNRSVLYGLLSYPFYDLNCQMVGSRVSMTDTALVRQLKAYGFDIHVIPRLFGREHDGAICTLTLEQWENNKFMPKDKRRAKTGHV